MSITKQSEAICPVCSGTNLVPLCQANEHNILRCKTCACDFVHPMPDEQMLKAYYDGKSYFQSDEKGSYSDYDLDTEGVLSLFSDFLSSQPNSSGKKILDIGCAFGTHLAMAAEQGWDAYGVELSSYAREIARARHGDKIQVFDVIASLPPAVEFDLIVMMDVLEHLPNPYDLFIDLFLHGAIGKNTQIVITTPNARSADAIANPCNWAYRYPPAHLVYFSAFSLKLLLTNLGGVDIAVQGIYPSGIDIFNDYPDESNTLNPHFKNCAGLMAVAQGFDTFFYKLLPFLPAASTASQSEITPLYREFFVLQKETAQKYALEIRHLNEVITKKQVDLEKINDVLRRNENDILELHQSTWYRLGEELQNRPMTVKQIMQIIRLITNLIMPSKSSVITTAKSPVTRSIRAIMIAVYKALLIVWSLKKAEHRRKFIMMLRAYWDAITQQPQLPSDESLVSIYQPEMLAKIDTKILLVIHELSRTGAPYAMLYLARALFDLHGVKPVIISPKEGSIRQEFEQEGFTVLFDPLLFNQQHYSAEACRFISSFEQVIVTSLACFNFIRYFRGIAKHLTWWIHETEVGFKSVASMTDDLSLLMTACESIWLGSPLCFPLAEQYITHDKLHLLLYGCPDTVLPYSPHPAEKMVFTIAGSLEPRKGQDLFLDAIERLPETLRAKALFRIIGSSLPFEASVDFSKKLLAKAALIPEVEYLENMPSDKLLEFYAQTDVLVSTSCDDPMPIVMTQGLMFSKVCLCSSAIGHAKLIKNGKNGLIFDQQSADQLAEKMTWLLENPDKLTALGEAGRMLYEKHFLMSSFAHNVDSLIQHYR